MVEDNPDNDKKEESQAELPISQGEAASPPPPPAAATNEEIRRECPKEISIRILEESTFTKLFELLSLLLTLATLIILVITFIVFYYQLQESKRQTEVFKKQADQAALDAQKAQVQTQTQIDLAKDSFKRDQQPYVWVTGTPTTETYTNPVSKELQVVVSAQLQKLR
jgi:hypothetical protein